MKKALTPYSILLIPGLALRLALVLNPEWLWYDESFSVLVARLPWARLWAATVNDVHPPLYYVVLKLWLAVWPVSVRVEIAARLLSFVLSVAGMWLYGRVLLRLHLPERERLTAMLLVVYAPSLIYHSAEARMYPLLWVLLLGAFLFLWEEDHAPQSTQNETSQPLDTAFTEATVCTSRVGDVRQLSDGIEGAAAGCAGSARLPKVSPETLHVSLAAGEFTTATNTGYGTATLAGVFIALAAWTHNAALYYAVALAAALLLDGGRERFERNAIRLSVAAGVAVLLWMPWAPFLIRQIQNTQAGYWVGTPSLLNPAYTAYKALFYAEIAEPLTFVAMALCGALMVWGALAKPALAVFAYGPLIVGAVMSATLGTGAVIPRILIPGLTLAFVGFAHVLHHQDVGIVLRVAVFALLIISDVSYITPSLGRIRFDYIFLDTLADEYHQGDIVYAASTGALPMEIYSPAPFYIAPTVNDIGSGLTLETQAALGLKRAWFDDVPAWDRAWVIYDESPLVSDDERAYLDTVINQYNGVLVSRSEYIGGSLWLLTNGN